MTTPTAYLPPSSDPAIDLDLSRNEGRTDAAALLAAVADPTRVVSRYPDTTGLRRRLAARHRVDPDQVLITAGGDDALHRCFLALVGDGGAAVTTYPTFEMIPAYAGQLGIGLVEVPWWSGRFPLARFLAAIDDHTRAAFLVSPNNPTGSICSWQDLERVASSVPYVVIDAAYGEFADVDLSPAALELGNAVVIRTLSKAYGLAGLRVGYLLGAPDLVARIGAMGGPYPVAALSAALAETRLDQPDAVTEAYVARVRRQREDLTRLVERIGAQPVPSQANFVLLGGVDAGRVTDAARSMGIALRRFPGRPGMADMVRISLPGDDTDFARLVAVLEKVLAPNVRRRP
jgi:histidinol-phosphate aminotransferase